MKLLVAGAGAIGQWLGSLLVRDGHDVTLLTRARHADAIRAGGLRIEGRTQLHGHVAAVTDVAALRPGFDAIFLTAKAHATAALAAQVAPLLAKPGVLVSLQNGLGNEQKLLGCGFAASQLAIATTSHGLYVERPGLVQHPGVGTTLIGPATGANDAAARLAWGILERAGLAPQWQDDMRGPVWRKAIVNHGLNTTCALAGARNGALLEKADLMLLATGLVEEGVALARRARVQLPAGDLVDALRTTVVSTRENKCSMLQDVEARRPTEVEQISGRMVRLGEKLLVSMPRSDSVYGRVKDLEASYLGEATATKAAWDEMTFEAEPF